jgi:hypothetical protein
MKDRNLLILVFVLFAFFASMIWAQHWCDKHHYGYIETGAPRIPQHKAVNRVINLRDAANAASLP